VRLLVASSSTGGHIYPALAIADRVRERDPDAVFLFVGATDEIGRDIVGEAGYTKVMIDATGFDRVNPVRALQSVSNFIQACEQARDILKSFVPDAVIGTGGYVCVPILRAAAKAGVHAYIQEQNVLPGLANKMAERYADRIFVGFTAAAEYFRNQHKVVVTGNPVRKAFLTVSRDDAREKLRIEPDDAAVLIFGGSQGADAINAAAVDVAELLGCRDGVRIFILTGTRMHDAFCADLNRRIGKIPERVRVLAYTDEMHEYFAAADLIVARAGALTVTEIAVCGKASVLIPSPNVVNNHQRFNAMALESTGAAHVLRDADIAGGGLVRVIEALSADKVKLAEMGEAALRIAKLNATDVIIDEIYRREQT
jgi:UDP-N-acetylglucosamine--N-acetylmuramyl-(pentapeptide) pyrophosphoryl-undecaprenol N-acetylglucosamine transferase